MFGTPPHGPTCWCAGNHTYIDANVHGIRLAEVNRIVGAFLSDTT